MSKRRQRRRERGFTLMELLITLGITTISLMGLLALHLSVARANSGTDRSSEAIAVATQTMELLRAQRTTDMVTTLTGSSTSVPPIDVTLGTAAGRNGLTYRRRVVVTAITTTLWRIRVEIGWTEDGATQGANGGAFDHLFGTELLRSTAEAL